MALLRRRAMMDKTKAQVDNLFDKEKITSSSYLTNGGDIRFSVGGCVSDFMDYTAGEQYYIKSNIRWRFAWYNSDKEFVGERAYDGEIDGILTAPANARYIRIAIYNDAIDSTIFRKV